MRRTGVMRGSEAARFKGGISAAWDPDRAAKRAAERAISSGLGGETGGGGTGNMRVAAPHTKKCDQLHSGAKEGGSSDV